MKSDGHKLLLASYYESTEFSIASCLQIVLSFVMAVSYNQYFMSSSGQMNEWNKLV